MIDALDNRLIEALKGDVILAVPNARRMTGMRRDPPFNKGSCANLGLGTREARTS